MTKLPLGHISALLCFFLILAGAGFCFQRLIEDISSGEYFTHPEELYHEVAFLTAYVLIILLTLRYGYYLATARVNWGIIKTDFLYLLNKKYFSRIQWTVNIILFWLALLGFIYSLAISSTQGGL